jgi:hypothetical protein
MQTRGGFETVSFPKISRTPGIYIVAVKRDGKLLPVYVGQAGSVRKRLGDYLASVFQAPTDFVVGTAIDYLQELGFEVVFAHKPADQREDLRRKQESAQIKLLEGQGFCLLNSRIGYKYRSAIKSEQEERVRHEVDEILAGAKHLEGSLGCLDAGSSARLCK